MTARYQAMHNWLNSLGYHHYSLTPASEDASFRSYHRLRAAGQSWVVMDAPPELEPCDQFVMIAQKLRNIGLSAPQVIESDFQQGFLLLSDFGDTDYLSILNTETVSSLYADALAALLQMQLQLDAEDLPCYDQMSLNGEMDLFHDWFLHELLNIELNQAQLNHWLLIKQALVDNALEQPQVFVHRDYHSRNLMKIDPGNPGILDFQDAVKGPFTYDLVSLLRDCYISWPTSCVERFLLGYYERVVVNGLTDVTYKRFSRWFNLMGVQRHLKAIGIFARLKIRDAKPQFLQDIPRTLDYIIQVSTEAVDMSELHALIDELNLKYRLANLS